MVVGRVCCAIPAQANAAKKTVEKMNCRTRPSLESCIDFRTR
jgi:hypothetical protein